MDDFSGGNFLTDTIRKLGNKNTPADKQRGVAVNDGYETGG
jgi:hypothetical protein